MLWKHFFYLIMTCDLVLLHTELQGEFNKFVEVGVLLTDLDMVLIIIIIMVSPLFFNIFPLYFDAFGPLSFKQSMPLV